MLQNKLKILYSLEEIKENGFKVNVPIPQEKICPYCNKKLRPKGILNLQTNTINTFIDNIKCNCVEAKAEQIKVEQEKEQELLEDFEKYRKQEYIKMIKQYYGIGFITEQFKNKTLENFTTNDENSKTKLAAERFINKFKDMKKGIIFMGSNGIGKTHITIAICNELIKQGVPVIFGTLTELLDKYKQSYKNNNDIELTKLYTKVDLLVIDDLGVEMMNDWMLSKLFIIINERMKNELPIIITTNYNIEQLKQRLSVSNKICETANSIISRLCYMCYRVKCKGNDYRIN